MLVPDATTAITLEVFGLPKSQGSKTGYIVKGRVVMAEGKAGASRAAFKSWREAVAQAGRDWQADHQMPLIDVACAVTIVFYLPRPKSAPKRVTRPATGIDVDKMARSVFDSLTGVLITNDARVCELHARKVFAAERPPGCTITVEVL